MPRHFVARTVDENGIMEDFYYDDENDKVHIQRVQDVEPIIKLNNEMYNMQTSPNYSDSNGNHLVARIPLVMIEHWKTLGFDWYQSTDNERRVWLDKPEHIMFKVRPGKLGGKVNARPMTTKVN